MNNGAFKGIKREEDCEYVKRVFRDIKGFNY